MNRGLLAALAVAALLRIFLLFAVSPTVEGDSHSYIREAKAIVTGVSLDADPTARRRPPGYPFFLAGIYSLSMDNNFLVALAQHLLGLVVVVLIYYFCAYFFGAMTAAVASLLVATDLYILFYEHAVLSDFLQLFLMTAGIFAIALYVERGKWAFLLAAGAAHGLLALTKTVYYLYFLVPLSVLFILNRGEGWKKRGGSAAAYAAAFFVLVFGWSAWSASRGATQTASDLGRNLMVNAELFIAYDSPRHAELKRMFREHEKLRVDHGGDLAWVELLVFKKYREKTGLSASALDKIYVDVALEAMRRHPDNYFEKFFHNLFAMYFPAPDRGTASLEYLDEGAVGGRARKIMLVKSVYRLANKALVALFFIGMALCLLRNGNPRRRAVCVLLALTVCYVSVLTCALNEGLIRYRLAVEPVIMLFAAIAVVEAAGAARRKVEANQTSV